MAMMTWMRRTSRYFLAVVVLTFIASLAYFGATQDKSNPAVIATVNGEEITAAAYDRAYRNTVEQYRQLFRERFTEDMLRSFRVQDQVVERLVTDRLMQQRAAAEGIGITDEELSAEIVKIPAFTAAGRFSREQYVRTLANAQLTPAAFEADVRAQLLARRLQGLVSDGVKVSEAEVRQHWEARRARVRAAWLLITPESLPPGPEPTDAELETYYKAHPAEFTRPERRRVLMALLPMTAVAAPSPTDAELEAAYEDRRGQFEQPERRQAAHILVRVPTTGGSAAEDEAKAKAEAVLQRVKAAAADFGQVAREVSEDPATGPKGGELGLISRGEMVGAFEKLVFELKAGEIGGPVRSGAGFHVVKVLQVVPGSRKELKEVAPTLRATLVAEGQLRLLRQRAEEAQQALLTAPDFGAEARRRGLTLREIGPLGRTDAVEGIGRVADASAAIFGLPAAGVSSAIKVPEGYAIFRLLETQESKLSPLAEVRPQVVEAVRREKVREAAEAKGKELMDALRRGEEPRAIATRAGVTAGETPPFSRTEPLGGADQEVGQAIGTLALELPVGGVGGPSRGPKGYYVVKVVARDLPDGAQFEAARKETERQILETKKGQAWQAWLGSLRTGATVDINRKVLPQQPQG
jgi:peptidyl-prolyl cis-trans isomerase D